MEVLEIRFAILLALCIGGIILFFDALCDCLSEKRGCKTLIGRGRREDGTHPAYFFRFWVGFIFAICAACSIFALG